MAIVAASKERVSYAHELSYHYVKDWLEDELLNQRVITKKNKQNK